MLCNLLCQVLLTFAAPHFIKQSSKQPRTVDGLRWLFSVHLRDLQCSNSSLWRVYLLFMPLWLWIQSLCSASVRLLSELLRVKPPDLPAAPADNPETLFLRQWKRKTWWDYGNAGGVKATFEGVRNTLARCYPAGPVTVVSGWLRLRVTCIPTQAKQVLDDQLSSPSFSQHWRLNLAPL